jgi:predicted NAD/FAD-dependent oxidoreductase
MRRIAIIGAGLAGLAAARRLTEAGLGVRLFDKGRGPGGRLATRRIGHDGAEHRFDHGAQYLRAEGAGFAAMLDEAGALPWPDPARRVAVPGMSALGRHLARGLDLAAGRQVVGLDAADGGWTVRHRDAARAGDAVTTEAGFEAVLVTVPAEQAIPLLPSFAARLVAIRYAPCWTVMAAFAARLDRPDVLRSGDGCAIGWAARDSAKPGRKAGQENWVMQAGPDWSRAHLGDSAPADALLREFAPGAPALFAVAHRWRFALLEAPLGESCLWAGGLGYASDGCLGGRGEAAWDSGMALAARVLGDA